MKIFTWRAQAVHGSRLLNLLVAMGGTNTKQPFETTATYSSCIRKRGRNLFSTGALESLTVQQIPITRQLCFITNSSQEANTSESTPGKGVKQQCRFICVGGNCSARAYTDRVYQKGNTAGKGLSGGQTGFHRHLYRSATYNQSITPRSQYCCWDSWGNETVTRATRVDTPFSVKFEALSLATKTRQVTGPSNNL